MGRCLRRSPGTVGAQGPPHCQYTFCFLTATGNPVPKPELPYTSRPLPCPGVLYIPRMLLINHQPFWQPTAAPHPRGGCAGGTGTDPTRGRVPAALCDLPAWRRWGRGRWVPLHPPHPAGQIPRPFTGADAPRFSRCSGHPDSSLASPSRGRARGTSLPLSVPQFPGGAGDATAASVLWPRPGHGTRGGHRGAHVLAWGCPLLTALGE